MLTRGSHHHQEKGNSETVCFELGRREDTRSTSVGGFKVGNRGRGIERGSDWGLGMDTGLRGVSSPSSWSLLNSICGREQHVRRDDRTHSIPLQHSSRPTGSHFGGGAHRDQAGNPATSVPFPAPELGRIPRGGIIGGRVSWEQG